MTDSAETASLEPYALYRYFDARRCLLYAGKTGVLAQRVSSHIARSLWMQFVASSTFKRHETPEDLARAEREAIKAEHPIFNKKYNNTPEAKERLHAYLEGVGRLDLLPQKRVDGDLIPALWEDGADLVDQIGRILASPCRHHALIRLMVAALVEGHRDLPAGQQLEALAAKVRISNGSAYRLAQLTRA